MRLFDKEKRFTGSFSQKNDFDPVKNRKATHMAVNVTQKDKEQVEYLRELVHDINESLERHGSDIPENKKD